MTGKNKKKGRGGLVLVLVLALLLVAGAAGAWWFFDNYAIYRGQIVPKNVAELDLRGEEVSDEELAQAEETFADAHILRDVVIAGRTYSSDAAEIAVGDFTAAEIPLFREFDGLKSVDATECADLTAILALREAMPGLSVTWTVPLGEKALDGDTVEIVEKDVSAEALAGALRRLPFAESVTLTESTLTPAEQIALAEEFPGVSFGWDVLLAGKRFSLGTELLDFEDTPLTEAQLAEIDEYLPLLETAAELRLGDSGLPEEAVRAFADAHPELHVAWNTSLFGVAFSTEDRELCFDDMALTVEDAVKIEALVPYMHNLTRVSMQRCGIDNDDMEAIYKRHIDTDGVKFVWMVQVTNRGVPTDQTFYHSYRWSNPDVDYYYGSSNQTFEQLRYCHDMIAIDLGHKRYYGDPDMFANMPHLRYLTVPDCAYTALPALGGLQELEYLEMYWSCGKGMDISYLKDCPNLKHLNIAYKRIKDDNERATDLATLKSMKQLKRLWISANMYSAEDVRALREALPDTQIEVMDTLNCVAKGWREGDQAYYDYRDALHMYYMSDESNTVLINPYTGERSQYEWTNPFR